MHHLCSFYSFTLFFIFFTFLKKIFHRSIQFPLFLFLFFLFLSADAFSPHFVPFPLHFINLSSHAFQSFAKPYNNIGFPSSMKRCSLSDVKARSKGDAERSPWFSLHYPTDMFVRFPERTR